MDLAYQFTISRSIASSIFAKWLDIIFIRMQPLILWPDRAKLWGTINVCFGQYFATQVAVITDYFEVL